MSKLRKILFLLIFYSFIISCNKVNKDNEYGFDKDFAIIIDTYIKNNPLNLPPVKTVLGTGFSYPCYQIYFSINDNNSVVNIIQSPHFNDFELKASHISADTISTYNRLKTKGFILYKKKYPLVIFDKNSIGKHFYNEKKLTNIPDSLNFKIHNRHITINPRIFKIINGKIIH